MDSGKWSLSGQDWPHYDSPSTVPLCADLSLASSSATASASSYSQVDEGLDEDHSDADAELTGHQAARQSSEATQEQHEPQHCSEPCIPDDDVNMSDDSNYSGIPLFGLADPRNLDHDMAGTAFAIDYSLIEHEAEDDDYFPSLDNWDSTSFTWTAAPPPPAPLPSMFSSTHLPPGLQAALTSNSTQNTTVNPLELEHQAQGEVLQDGQPPLPQAAGENQLGPNATGSGDTTPGQLGSRNLGLFGHVKMWARTYRTMRRGHGLGRIIIGHGPRMDRVMAQEAAPIKRLRYNDLQGDECDVQGVNWRRMGVGVTRQLARNVRLSTYVNYVNQRGQDRWNPSLPDRILPSSDSFFRFRYMDFKRNVHLSHFQLRNLLACTSGSRAFYTGRGVVHEFHRVTGEDRAALRFTRLHGSDMISTVATGHGILIAGGLDGKYCLRGLDTAEGDGGSAEPPCYSGSITTHPTGITNHVQIHESRTSSAPLATFASNDACIRVLDVQTQQLLSEAKMPFPINCTALSPDRRLRVSVGDHRNVLITATDSSSSSTPDGRPQDIICELDGHRDHGFACDWADDGWTVATAFQDMSVKVWDARRWTSNSGGRRSAAPVHTLRADMAGVRSLRFSPVGSGPRVLVAAEEADFVDVIDARTWRSKQTVDLFGEIAGVSFASEGRDLVVLCSDPARGGVMQLERCGGGFGAASASASSFPSWKLGDDDEYDGNDASAGARQLSMGVGLPRTVARMGRANWRKHLVSRGWWEGDDSAGVDWPESVFTEERRVKTSTASRLRRAARTELLEPF